MSEKSSTRMISRIRCSGDLSSMECTVRSKTDHASLWKHTITDVWGRFSKYLPGFLHLKYGKNNVSFYIEVQTWYIHYIIYYIYVIWYYNIIVCEANYYNITWMFVYNVYSSQNTPLPPQPSHHFPSDYSPPPPTNQHDIDVFARLMVPKAMNINYTYAARTSHH